jgi:hypothetical protein
MKNVIFLDMSSCSSLKFNRRFGWTHRLYLQCQRMSLARNQLVCRYIFARNVGWISTDYNDFAVVLKRITCKSKLFSLDNNIPFGRGLIGYEERYFFKLLKIQQTFRMNTLPLSSVSKNESSKRPACVQIYSPCISLKLNRSFGGAHCLYLLYQMSEWV